MKFLSRFLSLPPTSSLTQIQVGDPPNVIITTNPTIMEQVR